MNAPARRLREKIQPGTPVVGTFLVEFTGTAVVSVLGAAGFDFVMIDCEHGNYAPREVEAMVEAGWNADTCVLVRTPHEGRELITRALDAGAGGVVIPAVRSMDQVRDAVRVTKYRPLGQRGVHLFRGHTRHRTVEPKQFMAEANRDLLTFIQIELADAVDIVDEIAATEGVDGLYIGPGDLSVDLGVPGEWDSPRVDAAAQKTLAAAKKHGKIVGCHSDDIRAMARLREMGVQVFGYFCDIGMFAAAAKESAALFREVMNGNG